MDIANNKEIVKSFYEAGNRGDMEGCMALLADDITWTNIGSTKYSGSFVGKHDLTAKLLGPVFGRLKAGIESTIDNVIAERDFVVVQVRGRAETVEGRPYNNTDCHVFRLRGGKIVQVTEYFDTELVSRVLAT